MTDWSETTTPDRPRPMLRDQAYEAFMRYLFSGALKPTQLVSQRELCEALGVGMGPLREALKRLEAEHIVTLIPQRGIRILDIDEKVINDAFDLRKLIEVEAVRRFTLEGSRDAAKDLLARTAAAAEYEDRRPDLASIHALVTLDHEMHYLFLSALKNDMADALFRRIFSQLRLSRLVYRLRNYRDTAAAEEHMAILELVIAGDVDGGVEAMGQHIDASRERALGAA